MNIDENDRAMAAEVERLSAARSWVVEVSGGSAGPGWYKNAQRFANFAEAERAMENLQSRWFGPVGFRVSPSEDEPNYRWVVENGFGRAEGLVRHPAREALP